MPNSFGILTFFLLLSGKNHEVFQKYYCPLKLIQIKKKNEGVTVLTPPRALLCLADSNKNKKDFTIHWAVKSFFLKD